MSEDNLSSLSNAGRHGIKFVLQELKLDKQTDFNKNIDVLSYYVQYLAL